MRIFKLFLQKGILLKDLSIEQWKKIDSSIDEDIYRKIAPKQVVASRLSEGGTGFERVQEQLVYWRRRIDSLKD